MIGNSIDKLTKDERLILASSMLNGTLIKIVEEQITAHREILLNQAHQAEDVLLARTYREHAAKLEIWISIQQLQVELLKELETVNQRHGA